MVYCLPGHPSRYRTGAVRSLDDYHQEFRSTDDDFVLISGSELLLENFQVRGNDELDLFVWHAVDPLGSLQNSD